MKRLAFLLLLPLLASCSYIQSTSTDLQTHQPVESIEMGFWDPLVFVLWGVPYDRFRFTLRATGEQPNTRFTAKVECRHINAGRSFMIIADGTPYAYTAEPAGHNTMLYDIPAADLQKIAQASRITLRIDHHDKFDSATLLDQQRDALRTLIAKHGN